MRPVGGLQQRLKGNATYGIVKCTVPSGIRALQGDGERDIFASSGRYLFDWIDVNSISVRRVSVWVARLLASGVVMRWVAWTVVGLASVAACLSAGANEQKWYASLEGGASATGISGMATHIGLCGILFGCPPLPDGTTESGWSVVGAVGRHFSKNFRVELELGIHDGSFEGAGGFSDTTLIVNAIYDIPLSSEFTASFGAGLGLDWASTDTPSLVGATNETTALASQILAGISYAVSEKTALTFTTRYISTSGSDDLQAQIGTYAVDIDKFDHVNATIGLRFHF
jgi:opacity protein-like surface antigen